VRGSTPRFQPPQALTERTKARMPTASGDPIVLRMIVGEFAGRRSRVRLGHLEPELHRWEGK
jgi:hypothetical protein